MSTILKALRRLEEDRDAPPDRSLREEVADPEVPRRTERSRPSLVMVGVLLVAFVLTGTGTYWLVTSDLTSTDVTAAVTAAAPAPTSARSTPSSPGPPAVVADSRPHEPELSPAALESLVSVVKRDPPQPRISASPEMEVSSEVASAGPGTGAEPIFSKSRRSAAGLPGRHKGRVAIPVPTRRFHNQTTPEDALEPDEPPLRPVASAPLPLLALVESVPASEVAGDPVETLPTPVAASSSSAPPSQTASVSQPMPEPEAAPEPTSPPEPVESTSVPKTKQVASITPVTQPVPAEPEPLPKPAAAPEPTPAQTLAAESSSSGPTFTVERTVWHPIAAKRLAVVIVGSGAPREVREGDEIGTAVVAKIEPSGVIFSEQGKEFRRRIGD